MHVQWYATTTTLDNIKIRGEKKTTNRPDMRTLWYNNKEQQKQKQNAFNCTCTSETMNAMDNTSNWPHLLDNGKTCMQDNINIEYRLVTYMQANFNPLNVLFSNH